MDAAYIFGHLGNMSSALGAGWSVEDAYAWAVGDRSELTLALPEGNRAYRLRFDLHPLVFPPALPKQRLTVRSGTTDLGSFDLVARRTINIDLPRELIAGVRYLPLTLLHPDAARPSDHRPVDDSRMLALCFHSASCIGLGSGPGEDAGLEAVHGLIAGDTTAHRIAQTISKLPSMKGRLGVRFIDLAHPLDRANIPVNVLESAQFCWIERNAGTPATRTPLRQALPDGCAIKTFGTPRVRCLWPFDTPDPRGSSRYPYGNRLAQKLADLGLPEDVLYLMYQASAANEPIDLDAMYAADLAGWRAEGERSDLDFSDFIERHFRTGRLFASPRLVAPLLFREMTGRLLEATGVPDVGQTRAELDDLLTGFTGWREEVPVDEPIAAHFKLGWWSAGMKYRWRNNLRTQRDYILDYIGWRPWRP